MRILFVHQNFPGQYLHLAPALARIPGNQVFALTLGSGTAEGVTIFRYSLSRGSTQGIHVLASDFESKVIRGEAAAQAALSLKENGFTPDVICGHPGWGETLFLKDVWPQVPLLSFVEFVYKTEGADVGFDPEFPLDIQSRLRVRSKNAAVYLPIADADWLVTPTAWQGEQVPKPFHDRLSIIHDGIDTEAVKPNLDASVRLGRDGVVLRPGDEVVTFVNRNLEPYRGYHTFIRALPEILRKRPNARAILVGGDGVSYGGALPNGQTYRKRYLDEVAADLDMSRVHFVGKVPYSVFLNLLQVSAAHVYLTYPFVLSWSMLEAMASGCVVVGSSTRPVQEVISDGRNGILVDFLSPNDVASAVVDVLAKPYAYGSIKNSARETIVRDYDLHRTCLPRHIALITALVTGAKPA